MLISKKAKSKKLRHSEYYNMVDEFDKLYQKSKNNAIFNNLMELINCRQNILLAYRNIKNNTGSNTSGVDKCTIKDLKQLDEKQVIEYVQRKLAYYKPKPVKRVEIEKDNGKLRPLGIPTMWDRLIQQCILQVLEPICEAKFHNRSNGFRPNRSAENAIAQCYQMIQIRDLHFVVDIDIKGFFDNVNHCKLKKQMWSMGIQDKQLLCIISEMLKAPVILPSGEKLYPEKGTPQGGILSPLLSNIVLNELDWWIASQWEEMPTKKAYAPRIINGVEYSRHTKALKKSNLKEMYIVRYADDFKIFCRTRSDANKIFLATKDWLKQRLKLQISDEKSKIVNLKKHYSEFLGFKMKATPKNNRYVVKSHMVDKAIIKSTENLKNIIKDISKCENSDDKCKLIGKYNVTIWGLHNYYQIATNVSLDFRKIGFSVGKTIKARLKSRVQSKGKIESVYLQKKYGKSRQVRFVDDIAITPIAYVSHKNPKWKKNIINKYTKKGREEIHKTLKSVDMSILHWLMCNPVINQTIEYNDNRISRYSAQFGKCYVTGKQLKIKEIHCHHIKPKSFGKDDSYQNLIIVDKNVHILIHAVKQETINKYLLILQIDKSMLNKLNELRVKAGLEQI